MRASDHCSEPTEGDGVACRSCGAAPEASLETPPDATFVTPPERSDELADRTMALPPQPDPDILLAEPPTEGELSAQLQAGLNRAAELLADNRPQATADLCHRLIRDHPRSVQAYALLGMAEEELGHWRLALEAYETVVALDPARVVEQERIATLMARIETEAERPQRAAVGVAAGDALQRLGPVFLAASAGLLIIVIAVSLVLYARPRRDAAEASEAYQTQMRNGQVELRDGNYQAAAAWFQEALASQPGDQEAYRWLVAAQEQARQQREYDQWQQKTLNGKVLSIDTANLPTIPVMPNPTTADSAGLVNAPAATSGGGSGGGGPSWHSSPPPRIAQWPNPTDTTRGTGGVGPIQPPGYTETATPPTQPQGREAAGPDAGSAAETTKPEQPKPAGKILITLSERQVAARPANSGAAASGMELRNQADALRRSGDTSAALAAYQRAIQSLEQEIQDRPAQASAQRTARDSCIKAIEAIKAGQGR